MFMYIFFSNKFIGRRSTYNACYGRHIMGATAVIPRVLRSPYSHLFHLILKGICLERKINMIKWKKKSCVERKKQYTSIEGQGRVARKKNVPEWKNKCQQTEKKLNSEFWKTIMKELISFNFLCFQREFYSKFKPISRC